MRVSVGRIESQSHLERGDGSSRTPLFQELPSFRQLGRNSFPGLSLFGPASEGSAFVRVPVHGLRDQHRVGPLIAASYSPRSRSCLALASWRFKRVVSRGTGARRNGQLRGQQSEVLGGAQASPFSAIHQRRDRASDLSMWATTAKTVLAQGLFSVRCHLHLRVSWSTTSRHAAQRKGLWRLSLQPGQTID